MFDVPLADAHTHLDRFPEEELPPILERARRAGVGLILTAGVDLASSARCVDLAERFPLLYAGVGIHPMELRAPLASQDLLALEGLARSSPRVVCIGEVGLDFAPGMPDPAWQYPALREQVRLARALGLPVVFHSRTPEDWPEGHGETLRVLREERVWEVGGVFHYFQGDERLARAALDLGLLLSLAKPLLRLPALQETVRRLPLDALVLETDAYPQFFKRHRTRWTEPRDVRRVAEKVAELKGVPVEEVAAVTTRNLLRLLRGRARPLPLQAGDAR